MAVDLVYSRTYPVEHERAYDLVVPAPLPFIFAGRVGPLPPITHVEQADDHWGDPGQTRVIRTSDGGTMTETVVEADPPRTFAYELGDLTGPLKLLAATVEGRWTFAPAGTGVRITWSWRITPTSSLAMPVLKAVGGFWQGYARRGFDRLEQLLVDG